MGLRKRYKRMKRNTKNEYRRIIDEAKSDGQKMGEKRVEMLKNGNLNNESTAESSIEDFKDAYNKGKELPKRKLFLYLLFFVVIIVLIVVGSIF